MFDGVIEDPFGVDAWEAMRASMPPPPEMQAALDALAKRALVPLAAGGPRRHHFIPQSLLRRFANDHEQVLVVPINGGEPGLRGVLNTAVFSNLYTTVDPKIGETAAVETILAMADGEAARIVAAMVNEGALPLDEPDRTTFALWLAMLRVRGPRHRREMEALAEHILKMDLMLARSPEMASERLLINLGREPTEQEVHDLVDAANSLDDIEIVPHQNNLIKMMLDSALAMAPHLRSRRMTLLRFDEQGLVLCDQPVVLNQLTEHQMPNMGVGIINANEILLPLDRRIALVLHSNDRIPDGTIGTPDINVMRHLNQSIVGNADAEVYCHPDDVGRLDGLAFPDGDRPLVSVDGALDLIAPVDGVNAPPARRTLRRSARWAPDARSQQPDDGDQAASDRGLV